MPMRYSAISRCFSVHAMSDAVPLTLSGRNVYRYVFYSLRQARSKCFSIWDQGNGIILSVWTSQNSAAAGNKTRYPDSTRHRDFRRSACMTNNNMTDLFRHNQDMIGQFINFMFDTFFAREKSITIDSAFKSPLE